MNPIIHQTIEQILTQADKNVRGGPNRMMWFLHRNGQIYTGDVASTCEVSNPSDVAHRADRHLVLLGLKIVCTLPDKLLVNRYGDKSMSHIWRLTLIRE